MRWKGKESIMYRGMLVPRFVGGAERAGWESRLEVGSMDIEECQNRYGATILVVDCSTLREGSAHCGVNLGHCTLCFRKE